MITELLNRTKGLTLADLAKNHSVDVLLNHTVEELGEFAKARSVEQGIKNASLTESTKEEAVDVVICALSLFYASGGDDEFLAEYGLKKLKKWEQRLQ